jgi:transposase
MLKGEETGAVGVRRNFTREQVAKMDRLYNTGLSLQDVADHFKCTAETVRRRLREYGTELRPKANEFSRKSHSTPATERFDAAKEKVIHAYLMDKRSCTSIADEYGTNVNLVKRRLKEWGIPVRDSSEAQKVRHAREREMPERTWRVRRTGYLITGRAAPGAEEAP